MNKKLRIISLILIPLLILAGVEFVLGFLDLEKWDGLFVTSRGAPLFVPERTPDGTKMVRNPVYERSIDDIQFAIDSRSDTVKIFIIGGSAAYGWPMKNDSSFSGYLSRALAKVSDNPYDVINAAGMSFGSHRVRDVASQILSYSPDVVIIYSGNNEYVESNLYPESTEEGWLYALRDVLRRLDIYRALRLVIFRSPLAGVMQKPAGEDVTDPNWSPLVARAESTRNEKRDEIVLDNYSRNIAEIVRDIRSREAVAILVTVPVNLADWRPVDQPGPPETAEARSRWNKLWDSASRAAIIGDFQLSAAYFEQLEQLRPDSARAKYYLGNSLRMIGQYDRARTLLSEARDLDARPFRARSSMNDVIRDVAEEEDVSLIDLERFITDLSDDGIVGSEYFLDYCHLNGEGHRILAREVIREMFEIGLVGAGTEDVINSINKDNFRSTNMHDIAGYYYALGMTNQFNGQYQNAEAAYHRLLEINPTHTMGLSNLGVLLYRRGEKELAKSYFKKSLEADGKNPVAHANYGIMQMENGDFDSARASLQAAIELNTTNYRAHLAMGKILLQEGNFEQAIRSLDTAQELGVPGSDLYKIRGKAKLAAGERVGAIEDLQMAAQLDPKDSEVQEVLKSLTAAQ